jgi:hypothetical protein
MPLCTLALLFLLQDDAPVRERGPQRSIISERSFPPIKSADAVRAVLRPLVHSLLARALADAAEHARLPAKLTLSWRQGYGSNPRSSSMRAPEILLAWLRDGMAAAGVGGGRRDGLEEAVGACVEGSMGLLDAAVGSHQWEITRLVVGVAFEGGSSTISPGSGMGRAAGFQQQRGITSFLATAKSSDGALIEDASTAPQRHAVTATAVGEAAAGIGMAGGVETAVDDGAAPAATAFSPAEGFPGSNAGGSRGLSVQPSYRNSEALALRKMFGAAGEKGDMAAAQGFSLLPGREGGGSSVAPALSPDDEASLQLALRLQREEVERAAGTARPGVSLDSTMRRGRRGHGSGAKAQRGGKPGVGPLDAFLKRS